MEPVAALESAFAHTGKIVSNISPEQMSQPTPCSEWDVSALLAHTTGVIGAMGGAVGGPATAEGASFDEVAQGALEGWRAFDLDSTLDFPQPGMSSRAVAAAAMASAQMIVTDDLRAGRLGPAVDAPDASASDQFAAFLGRQV